MDVVGHQAIRPDADARLVAGLPPQIPIKGRKISSLKVDVSPKSDATPNLRLTDLAVDDICRLAPAVWCVV